MVLVGEPAAGKTTLCRKFLDAGFELQKAETDMTRGIAVTPWRFPYQNPKNTPVHEGFDGQFTAHIFDFGGQDILHATHRYFFSRRTVYVLVVDTRPEDTDFYYWLNIIELFGEQSPVVIVLNNKHGIYKEVPTVILEQFQHLIKGVFHVNLANNEGLESLTTQVQTLLQTLPHVGEERHPKVWNKVRNALAKYQPKRKTEANLHLEKPYIRRDELIELCQKNKLVQENKAIGIAQTLHVLGSLLYFHENPFLEDFIILDKHWATEAVYLVLQDEAVAKNHGKFTSKDLERLWRGKYKPDTYAPLSELMLNFKIAYRTREHNTYIAPQLLKENPPENYAEVMQASASFRFEYRYTKFMPKGLLSRLIVEKNRQIHEGLQWRTGVVLKIRNALVEAVEHRYGSTNKLAFRAVGENAHVAMEAIFELFEEIHGEFPNLKFEEMIPCHCADCEDSPAPNFFPYQRLQEAQKKGLTKVQCQISWIEVSLQRLLQGYEKLASDKAERWIDKGNFSEFFAEFEGKMEDMDKPLFEKLRYQFIAGNYDYDFYERARVLRRKYI
jgi:GTPase SAR1 family protein